MREPKMITTVKVNLIETTISNVHKRNQIMIKIVNLEFQKVIKQPGKIG